MDQRLATCVGKESADHVGVDDVDEGVALLGEAVDVILKGLAALLLAALEVPGVSWADIRALEVADEHRPEVRLATDRVDRQELEPGMNVVS